MMDLTLFQDDGVFRALKAAEPVYWHNPHYVAFAEVKEDMGLTLADVEAAEARLQRFAPYLASCFADTDNGVIESRLHRAEHLQSVLGLNGALYIKADNELPVSGSIKARGGIYEVLCYAEQLALAFGVLTSIDDDYLKLATEQARTLFAQYTVAVGSTGNLGLSIGLMAATLGFQAVVHMSVDAKQWKKDKLRESGVTVVEYAGDYGEAVRAGRELAKADAKTYFVDDEQSTLLFLGYAVAGLRLKRQLLDSGVQVGVDCPLIVYLPCGVGGGPGGVCFGLKWAFGDAVRCVFVEPTHSPCMFLGLYTGLHDAISVQDIGLDNRTIADGLAVGRASGWVGRALARCIAACATVADGDLYRWVQAAYRLENMKLEPSAAAALAAMSRYAGEQKAVYVAWTTGGSMVPDEVFQVYLQDKGI